MVEVNKNIAALSLKWLEVLLDENDTLSNEEKGQIQTLINFWRMYCSFTSEQFLGGAKVMLQAFLYGAAGMAGALLVYTAYDGIFTFCAWMHSRKNASANSKRRKRQETRCVVPNATAEVLYCILCLQKLPKTIII